MSPLLIVPALLLAAPVAAQAADTPYRALGTEPFWSLTITGKTIRYEPMSGPPLSVAKPRPIVGINGERYRARGMTVDITHVRCSDGMSDRTYPDTVRVTIGRQTLSGCGAAAAQPDGSLTGTWRIALVNGAAVRLPRPATLSFAGDRLSGRICNSFGGTYRFARGTLTTGEVIGTQMACADGSMRVESAVYAALGKRLKVHRGSRADTLVLSDGRSSLTLRRAR